MIIEPVEVTEDGFTFLRLTHSESYWSCGGAVGSTVIDLMTKEDSPLEANSKADGGIGMRWGFGATSFAELVAEIAVRELTYPTLPE